jgi:predicted phage terminase large subunit-like protein
MLLGAGLSQDSSAAYRWRTDHGGEYYAVGVGVGIMGFRARLGIIDDPFGSREDAESKRIRDKVWEWYVNDFSSRLRPGAKRIIMHQRFHEDDLAGRIVNQLNSIGKPFRRLKIRAESLGERDDPLGRPAGELLWDDPNGYNYAQFLKDRKIESDARTWSSLYQQEPTPEEGDYFKSEWIVPVQNLPPLAEMRVYGGSDYAVTSDGGDYTVHAVIGLDPDENMYLLDIWRKQAASDEWVEAWCDLVLKWKPMGWSEEQGQIKSGVGPFLDRRSRERRAYCARDQFPTRGDKAIRAQSIRGRMALRGLRVLASAPWRNDLVSELLRFPAGVHDDQCLAEGTLIRMADGSRRPIETVVVGDVVATPIGPCEVSASGVTNEAALVYRVTTACGRELVATGSHPVYVEGKGFVRVDALGIMDQITLEPSCYADHQKPRSLNIAATVIAAILIAKTERTADISTGQSRGAGSCTGIFGRMSAGLSLMGTTFTILTATRQITPSGTLRASRRLNIAANIRWLEKASKGNWPIWSESGQRPLRGIQQTLAQRFIARTAARFGKAVSLFVKHVRRAAQSLRLGLSEPNFALAPANSAASALAGGREADMSPLARLSPANAAIVNSSRNGLMMQCIAQKPAGCVIAIEALSQPMRVRNLTVKHAHTFYANGLLTHNCDALGLIGQLLDKMSAGVRPAGPEARKRPDEYKRAGQSSYSDMGVI